MTLEEEIIHHDDVKRIVTVNGLLMIEHSIKKYEVISNYKKNRVSETFIKRYGITSCDSIKPRFKYDYVTSRFYFEENVRKTCGYYDTKTGIIILLGDYFNSEIPDTSVSQKVLYYFFKEYGITAYRLSQVLIPKDFKGLDLLKDVKSSDADEFNEISRINHLRVLSKCCNEVFFNYKDLIGKYVEGVCNSGGVFSYIYRQLIVEDYEIIMSTFSLSCVMENHSLTSYEEINAYLRSLKERKDEALKIISSDKKVLLNGIPCYSYNNAYSRFMK